MVSAIVLLTQLAAPQTGPLAIVPIVAPHLLLLCVVLVPLAVLSRSRVLIGGLVAAAVLAVVLLGDEWVSLPVMREPAAESADLLSWNLQLGARTPEQAVETLASHRADVVVLQELTNNASAAIEADATLRNWYPYRTLAPDPGTTGLGILSAYPIEREQLEADPATLTVTVLLDAHRELRLLNAHPLPAAIGLLGFHARTRDERLDRLRQRIESMLAEGDAPLVVMGDFNVASSEPAYRELAAGLRDVHREVGFGPGWTWRPERLIRFGVGLIRIDYVLTSQDLAPRATAVDCRQLGDHCILMATVDLPPTSESGGSLSSRAR
jgi:endonuclease/exonuclease/phosphatase (EEP) superfamily protein YafD